MLIGYQVRKKRERKGGREGEGKIYSFPLNGSIFCHGFRIRCRTGH